MKILVADDEKWVRAAIINVISFGEFGMELVGEASDGAEALERCKALKPDLLLTDICMPGMSGLELIRELREVLPQLKVVIISGHNDFDYAKTAIKYGVSEYLLKPIDEDELLEILAKLSRDTGNGGRVKRVEASTVISQLLKPNTLTSANMNVMLDELGLQFEHEYFTVAVFSSDSTFSCSRRDSRVDEIIRDNLTGKSFGSVDIVDDSTCSASAAIINHSVQYGPERFTEAARSAITRIEEKCGLRYSAGISTSSRQLAALSRLYTEAANALDRRFWENGEGVFVYNAKIPVQENIDIKFLTSDIEDIVNNIKICNLSPAYACIDFLFSGLTQIKNCSAVSAREFVWSFVYLVMSRLDISPLLSGDNAVAAPRDIYRGIMEKRFISELREYIKETLESVYGSCVNRTDNEYEGSIETAKRFIELNYCKDISMEDTAQHVGLAPAYFSQLFKKKSGKTFTEYRTGLRIERAKQLCSSSSLPLHLIGEAVGYGDPKHFCKLFKKLTGMSLSAYRKHFTSPFCSEK